MNRLHHELHRLFGLDPLASALPHPVATDAPVRALVLEVARPADWAVIGAVWQGVQTDLGLSAPAIAVNGRDGYQLWFALAEAVPAQEAQQWLSALQGRYLADLPPERVTCWPAPQDPTGRAGPAVPSPVPGSDHWSAFVAPDLAPIFAAEPWLDIPPGEEAQADILLGLRCLDPAALRNALRPTSSAPLAPQPLGTAPSRPDATTVSPRAFLRQVMNDPAVPLALRIEAAKALLPYEG